MLWYELTRWWAYRQIQHPMMRYYVWVVPSVLALLITVIFFALPVRPSLAGENGVLVAIVQVLALLPGFFIAALAAVATFNRPEMDQIMPASAPKIKVKRLGDWIDVELTRRTFLTYLFSYLAVSSLLLTIICVAANFIAPSFQAMLEVGWLSKYGCKIELGLKALSVLVLSYVLSSILITTLHGIYFICERIHQPQ